MVNRINQNEWKTSNKLFQENMHEERTYGINQPEVWCGQTKALVRACQQLPIPQKVRDVTFFDGFLTEEGTASRSDRLNVGCKIFPW